MRLTFGQELRQEQRQLLTQRMIQSMEILQLTLQQLEERIEQEVSENPVLELAADTALDLSGIIPPQNELSETSTASGDTNNTEEGNTGEDNNTEEDSGIFTGTGSFSDSDITVAEQAGFSSEIIEPEIRIENEAVSNSIEEFALLNEFAQSYSGVSDEEPVRSQQYLDEMNERDGDRFGNIPDASGSFQSYLEEQFGWFEISEELHQMAWRIINNLDAKGYFPYDLPDFLGENHTPEELALAKEALAFVQKLEPRGTAGRDLRDCLRLQIPPDSSNAGVLRSIINSYLEDVSVNRLPAIVKATGFSIEKIQSAVAELKHFNPIPSAGFGNETTAAIYPDVIIEADEKGEFSVRVTNERIPQLRISKLYRSLVRNAGVDQQTKEYIRKKVNSAKWLIEAVEQRQSTLHRVASAILKHQIEFFRQGPQAIRPLKMQQIADDLDIHITTVSRACDEKWMMTPEGIFPFSRFFVTGLETTNGEGAVANDVVQMKIRAIIEDEDKCNPLSDDEIVKCLDEDGIRIARRTVVKYRQKMRIPNSRGRKEWKTP
ncbi:MAG: RNA polymerase factor sigma-54 [Planctomycetaceae bacterium]|jgi:RNA polymerase sigma-54 factor|nr:RNA polymerase factor sigma-54 [Planctomycetaceae bacterium]